MPREGWTHSGFSSSLSSALARWLSSLPIWERNFDVGSPCPHLVGDRPGGSGWVPLSTPALPTTSARELAQAIWTRSAHLHEGPRRVASDVLLGFIHSSSRREHDVLFAPDIASVDRAIGNHCVAVAGPPPATARRIQRSGPWLAVRHSAGAGLRIPPRGRGRGRGARPWPRRRARSRLRRRRWASCT